MTISIQTTADGSQTVFSDQFQETYHSVNGAIVESKHVFIEAGFNTSTLLSITVFEVGFGTGLNALLTLLEARKRGINVVYHSIELYPLQQSIIEGLEYAGLLSSDRELFSTLHDAPWNRVTSITPWFELKKIKADLLDFTSNDNFDVIYFDAFSPNIQPDLWSKAVFQKLYDRMNCNGILTTYCAKGVVRRTLQEVGFSVERLAGPPGKREMLRGKKVMNKPVRI